MEKLQDTSFKHFDLPVNHLSRHGHYVPPKARDEAEIARRRTLQAGTLLSEQQERGTNIAARALHYLTRHEDSDFMPKLLAAAGLNTAWHNHAQKAPDVMRRRLWLPVHSRLNRPVQRESLLTDSACGFDDAAMIAGVLRAHIAEKSYEVPDLRKKYARRLGNSAIILACVPAADLIDTQPSEYGQQYFTRRAALTALQEARNLEEFVGANPTLAQLADHDSPLSVYIRREGTNTSVEALEFATSSEVSSL